MPFHSTEIVEEAPFLARLHPDGAADDTFINESTNRLKARLLETSEQKIVWVSEERLTNGSRIQTIQRCDQDGKLDASFNGFAFTNGHVSAMCAAPAGTLLLSGYFPGRFDSENKFVRLDLNGQIDNQFQPPFDYAYFLTADQTGIVAAHRESSGFKITRLLESGPIDPAFNKSSFYKTGAEKLALENGGTILAAGNIIQNGEATPVLRFQPNGRADTNFQQNISTHMGRCEALAIDLSSNIYVAGRMFSVDYVTSALARFKPSGELDTGFTPVPTYSRWGLSISVIFPLVNGKTLIGGSFFGVGGGTRHKIARLNSDGSLDGMFDAGELLLNVFSHVTALAVTTDGKIYVAGLVEQHGSEQETVLRLNNDGSRDASLRPMPTGYYSEVSRLFILPDNRLLIGGYARFDAWRALAKLNPDGSIDPFFQPEISDPFLPLVRDFVVQPDGKIIIAGNFDAVGNWPARGLARLQGDGTVDTTFLPQLEKDSVSVIHSILLHPDGSLYVSGDFTSIAGEQRFGLARFVPAAQPSFAAPELLPGLVFRSFIKNHPGRTLTIQTSVDLNSWSLLTELTPATENHEFVQRVTDQKRFYRLIAE